MPIEKDKPTKVIDYKELDESNEAEFNRKLLTGEIQSHWGNSQKDRMLFLLQDNMLW